MTYCIGWKVSSGVLLAADSAVTWLGEPPPQAAHRASLTSIGERQGLIDSSSGPRYVTEEALKLRKIGDSLVAIAGNLATASSLLRTLEAACASGLSCRSALTAALISNQPFSQEMGASLLYAFYEEGKPQLLQLDTEEGGRIHEVELLAQIGSIREDHRRYSQDLIRTLHERYGNRPLTAQSVAKLFSQIVSVLQSYGVHDYLVAQGVGGAFVGAWVTAEGATWQDDIFYMIHAPEPSAETMTTCAVMVREGVACLLNNTNGFSVALTNIHHGEDGAAANARADRALSLVCGGFDAGLFEYFVFINKVKHIVSVIHMERNRHHELLYVDAYEDEAGIARIGVVWTSALLDLVNTFPDNAKIIGDELTLQWLPYRPASPEQMRFIESAVCDLRT